MVDIAGIIPLSIGGIIGLFINVIIITIVLALSNRLLAHEMSVKNSFIMALIAYLVVPVVLGFLGIAFPFSFYIIPLIIWLLLGEVLLRGDRMTKLKAAAVAFVVYLILTFLGLPGLIAGLIPF